MPVSPGWPEIAQRLAWTLLGGILIGLNRDERGRPAGLRTVTLVALAACVAMIEANLLLGTGGKSSGSFASMDVMRLPLGILDGMGFIGAGAILKRGRLMIGVTTAATLWFVTVMGLCFGGGQRNLGLLSLALGLVILCCFRWFERRLRTERLGVLTLTVGVSSAAAEEMESTLQGFGFRIVSWSVRHGGVPEQKKLRYEVRWTAPRSETRLPRFVAELTERNDIVSLTWHETLSSEP